MSNVLTFYCKTTGKTVVQKYLTKGHTQMEGDSVHSLTERRLKKKQVYSPAGHVTFMQEAKPSYPYCVKYLNHSFFNDYSSVTYRTSIRPGNEAGDPQVLDLVALTYNPNGNVQYKAAFDEEWAELPQRERAHCNSTPPV